MRNLKKVLSLALALVMLLGMMVVGAGAAETKFPDDSKIENKEAVAVANAIGVLLGDENGNFNPNGTLNRAQAAVVIAKLDLGGSAAGALTATGASKFIDVGPSFAWAQPYIDYCAGRELIVGDGTGKFLPGKNVTGVEFAIMLSNVLGYNSKAEKLGGADWALKGAALAQKAGLTTGVAANTSDMTRDNMAQMVLNALVADTVEYPNGTGTDISVNGAAVTIGAGKAEPKKHVSSVNDKLDSTYDRNRVSDLYNWKLCEEKYPDLKLDTSRTDDFERPIQVWTYNRKDVYTNVVPGYVKYTTSVPYKTIRSALNANGIKVAYYKDGRPQTAPAANDSIGGNGVLTQAWFTKDDNGNDLVKLTEVHTYVGTVNAVNSKNEEATVAAKTSPNGEALDSATYSTTSAVVGDLITYQAAWDGENYDVVSAKPLGEPASTGTLTEWNGTNTNGGDKSKGEGDFTVGGSKYEYSAHRVINNDSGTYGEIWGYNVNRSELNVYVDDYDYAIYVDTVATEINYAAVIGVGNTNAYGSSTNGCTLLFADGTQKQVQYRMSNNNKLSTNPGNQGSGGKQTVDDMIGDVVTYTVDSNDVYTLTLAGESKDKGQYGNTVDQGVAKTNESFTNGKSVLKLGAGAGDTYYTTAKTVFFVCTGNTTDGLAYTAYTGYAKMPSFDPEGITGYALVTNGSTKLVNAVYIAAPNLLGTAAASTYFVKQTNSPTASNSDGNYYILPAVVDGEVTTIKVSTTVNKDASFASKIGLFAITNVITNDKGIITSFTDNTNSVVETSGAFRASTVVAGVSPLAHTSSTVGTVRDPNGRAVLGIGNGGKTTDPNPANNATFWAYNDDTKVFVVDKDYKTISVSSPAAVVNDVDDLVFAAIANDTKVLTNVFIVTQTTGGGSTQTPTPDGKITTKPVSSATEKNGLITIEVALIDATSSNKDSLIQAAIIEELGKMGYVPTQFPGAHTIAGGPTTYGPFIASSGSGTKYYMAKVTDYLTVTVDETVREWFVYNTQPFTTKGDISKIGLAKSSNKGTGYVVSATYAAYNRTDTTKVGTANTTASLSYETGYVKVDQTVEATDISGVATDTSVIDAATVVTGDVTTPATDAYAKAGSDVKVTVTVTADKTTTVKHDITLKYKLTPQGGSQTTKTLSDVWVLPVGTTAAPGNAHEFVISNVQGDIDDAQAFVVETMEAHNLKVAFSGLTNEAVEGMKVTVTPATTAGAKKDVPVTVTIKIEEAVAGTDPSDKIKLTLPDTNAAWVSGDTNGTSVKIEATDAKILKIAQDALIDGAVTVRLKITPQANTAAEETYTIAVAADK